ncbi:MAG: hypothetical protein ACLFV7_05175 [Phycisphaerae bacterium]
MGISKPTEAGSVLLGDADEPMLRIQWIPRPRGWILPARPDSWLRRQVAVVAGRGQLSDNVPQVKGFPHVAWAPEGKTPAHHAAWAGWHDLTGMAILLTLRTDDQKVRRLILERVLPTLEISGENDPVDWSLFQVSFRTPPDYTLRRQRLNMGDLTLELGARGGRLLTVRQLYPAELALNRRKMDNWLKYPPLKNIRRRLILDESLPLHVDDRGNGGRMKGIVRTGVHRVKFPLGFLARRGVTAACVEDTARNRLRIAMHEAPSRGDEHAVREAIARMNLLVPNRST